MPWFVVALKKSPDLPGLRVLFFWQSTCLGMNVNYGAVLANATTVLSISVHLTRILGTENYFSSCPRFSASNLQRNTI